MTDISQPTPDAPETPSPSQSTTPAPTSTPTQASTEKTSLINEPAHSGAPEAYADFSVPDGMELDGEVSKEAGTIFKELNLTQDQGQRLVDFYNKTNKEAFAAPFKVWEDKQKEWAETI